MNHEFLTFTVGEPWDTGSWPLPTGGVSIGWYANAPELVVIGDPPAVIDADAFSTARFRIGFATHGPLTFLMLDDPCLGPAGGFLEAGTGWLHDQDAPEVTIEDADHIVWSLVLVTGGTVSALRAFTTSPAVTRWLRRARAEQRATGPLTGPQFLEARQSWITRYSDPKSAWRAAELTSWAGD